MKVRLPDRNDALVLGGGVGVVAGIWLVLPWLAIVIGSLFLMVIGIVTAASDQDQGH